jgi:hypothetical protein
MLLPFPHHNNMHRHPQVYSPIPSITGRDERLAKLYRLTSHPHSSCTTKTVGFVQWIDGAQASPLDDLPFPSQVRKEELVRHSSVHLANADFGNNTGRFSPFERMMLYVHLLSTHRALPGVPEFSDFS